MRMEGDVHDQIHVCSQQVATNGVGSFEERNIMQVQSRIYSEETGNDTKRNIGQQ